MSGQDLAERIKQAYQSEPFKPFTVTLKDGTKYAITRPSGIWVALRSHLCIIMTGEDSSVFVDTSYLQDMEPQAA
jgi:hypothetical protein